MQPSPSQRRARTNGAARPLQLPLALALLALLAQILLPHVHRWQMAAGHGASGSVQLAAGKAALGAAHHSTEHAESRCPVCQALAASHDFLVASAHHPAPAAGSLAHGPLPAARTAHTPATAHAPRSPPLAA